MKLGTNQTSLPPPTIRPLGDAALVVSFETRLSLEANAAAIAFSKCIADESDLGVLEVVPSLVSVLVRYDPRLITLEQLSAKIRMAKNVTVQAEAEEPTLHNLPVTFGGEDGPDLSECAATLGMSDADVIRAHNRAPLSVLSVGFAPGFVYCGLHVPDFSVPRRTEVRPMVPAGSVLFAAGQTAIAATDIPTGWSVIGRTTHRNFQPDQDPPVQIVAGDRVAFIEQKS